MPVPAALSNGPIKSPADERRSPREPVGLPALIVAENQHHGARLHDCSLEGAMIESSAPLEPRNRLVLRCGTIQVEAVVLWGDERRYGIEFETPLSEEDMAQQIVRAEAVARRRRLRPKKA